MRVELINTGSELLLGQVLNTHAQFLALRLAELGLSVQRQTTVPDGPSIREAMTEAIPRTDLLLVTGGLGPTSDDITRDVAAELLGLPLEFHPEIWGTIQARFARRQIEPPPEVKSQAMVPRSAVPLPNPNGTAPGLWIKHSAGILALLPGPPRELQPMVEAEILPRLHAHLPSGRPVPCRILRTLGVGESALQHRFESRLRALDPRLDIGYCARSGEVDLRLIHPEDPDVVDRAVALVRAEIGDHVYAEGRTSLEEVVVHAAIRSKRTIAVAESCTGGLICHRITSVPGASQIFVGGAVTYSNAEKIRALGVPPALLEQHGAVSLEVATAMASGLRERTGADIAVATTGIAGPSGGSEEKPVGTCCFALVSARRSAPWTLRRQLSTERDAFQWMASRQALDMLRRELTSSEV